MIRVVLAGDAATALTIWPCVNNVLPLSPNRQVWQPIGTICRLIADWASGLCRYNPSSPSFARGGVSATGRKEFPAVHFAPTR